MKKLYILTLGLLPFIALSQQDVQFTQFMHNRLYYNPGVAGSGGAICVTGFHRSQWVGFEGAPTTQNFTANIPIKAIYGGIGLSVTNDQLGFFQNISAGLGYSYQLQMASGTLGFGLMGHLYSNAVNNAVWRPVDPGQFGFPPGATDPSIAATDASGVLFDLSFGAYYEGDKFWAGVSSTRLMETNTDVDNYPSQLVGNNIGAALFTNARHYYFMGGYNWPIPSTNWELRPSAILKMDFLASPQADVNITGVYNNRFWGGVTYRLTDAIGVNISYQFFESFRAGYSYDIPISPLATTAGGSHELFLNYCFKVEIPPREKGSYKNPRFL